MQQTPTPSSSFDVPDPSSLTLTEAGATGAQSEAKPAPFRAPSQADAVDEVFLTPRVIDQSAFTRYSHTLRELIREASGSGQTLESSAKSAHVLVQESKAAGADLRTKIEAGARLVKMVDQRAGSLTELTEKAASSERLLESIDETIEARLSERLGEVQSRLEHTFEAFASRASQAEARLASAEKSATTHAHRLEALLERMSAGVVEMEHRASKMLEEARAEEQRLRARTESLAPMIEATEALCRRTLASLGVDPEGEGDPSAAAGLLTRIDSAREDATTANDRLLEIKKQADQARSALGSAIVEAADRIDTLDARATEASERARQGLESVATHADAISSATERLERLRRDRAALDEALQASGAYAREIAGELGQHREELETLLDRSLQRLGGRVEEAGAWLGGLISRAAQTGQMLERLTPTPSPSPSHTPDGGAAAHGASSQGSSSHGPGAERIPDAPLGGAGGDVFGHDRPLRSRERDGDGREGERGLTG